VVLQDLLEDLGDRIVVAVTFLAMLELVKGRELIVLQETPFGPIVCRSRSAA
jgi:chromatin segregation and condensation protein Rec8/ScpA/Scc1 (kleisin family)